MTVLARPFLVAVGRSTDAWEQPDVALSACALVSPDRVFGVSPRHLPAAVARLEQFGFAALTDDEAALLLDVARDPSFPTLSAQLLATRIAALSEQRRLVYSERRGSWSMMNQNNLNALNETIARLHDRPLTPFLVRALAADDERVLNFTVATCDDTLQTTTFPVSGTTREDRPDRVAVVVLLHGPPERVVPAWTYDDPELNR